MSTELMVSIVGLISVFVKLYFEFKKMNQLINYRLDNLEKKVDLHNGYAKMFNESSKDITAIQKDIEWLKRRQSEQTKNSV